MALKPIVLPVTYKSDDSGLQKSIGSLGAFVGAIGAAAAAAAAAIGGLAVAATREAMAFESSFAKIEGLVGVTGPALGELEDAARKLGPAMGQSATQAADALFFITSAGLRGADAVTVLEASLKGAAIGLGDSKTVADLATSAVNAYTPAVLDGARAVDVLAEAVREGKLEPAELAGSMGQVLPVASAMGVSFEEVGAAFAAMSRTGTNAATASTQLRGILNSLLKPSQSAEKALKGMGLSSEGLRKQIKDEGLLSVLETLTEKFDGNDAAAASVFGNVRALSGVLDLMGGNVEATREIFSRMTDDIYVLDEAFEVASNTTEFKFSQAMAKAKDGLLEIGNVILDRLQPHLDKFLSWVDTNGPVIAKAFADMFDDFFNFIESKAVQDLVKQFSDLWPQIRDTAAQIGELVVKLVPLLLDALGQVLPMLGDLAGIMEIIGYFIEEVIGLFVDWGDDTPDIINWLEKQINPMIRLAEAIKFVYEMLVLAQAAWDRWVATQGSRFRGGGGAGGGRAFGGPVSPSMTYLVGEHGPELFSPFTAGNIIPNNRIAGTGDTGTVINLTVHAGIGTDGANVGQQIVSAIRKYEKISGPVFVSV